MKHAKQNTILQWAMSVNPQHSAGLKLLLLANIHKIFAHRPKNWKPKPKVLSPTSPQTTGKNTDMCSTEEIYGLI